MSPVTVSSLTTGLGRERLVPEDKYRTAVCVTILRHLIFLSIKRDEEGTLEYSVEVGSCNIYYQNNYRVLDFNINRHISNRVYTMVCFFDMNTDWVKL